MATSHQPGLFTSLLLESVAMVGAIFAASVRARLPLSPRGPCCGVMFEEETEKRELRGINLAEPTISAREKGAEPNRDDKFRVENSNVTRAEVGQSVGSSLSKTNRRSLRYGVTHGVHV